MSLIQKFELEADDKEQLRLAIKILLNWTKSASHYISGVDAHGTPFLSLLWNGTPKGAMPLIAPLSDAEPIALQIESWLKTVEYGTEPDHDGDNNKGFRLIGPRAGPVMSENAWNNCEWNFYTILTVQPEWIEYGK